MKQIQLSSNDYLEALLRETNEVNRVDYGKPLDNSWINKIIIKSANKRSHLIRRVETQTKLNIHKQRYCDSRPPQQLRGDIKT